jgi:hypothetical protein
MDAEGFWHCQVPVDSICIYRAGFGLLVSLEALTWLPYSEELFSSAGFHLGPLADLAPPPFAASLLCALLALSAFCVAIGLRTKTSLVMTTGLWLYLYAIDFIQERAISTIAMVVMVVLLFAPCGRRYSVDDWLVRRLGARRRPASICVFPMRLLQLEFAQVYFFASLTKLVNHEWSNGTIFERSLESRWATDFGVWISGWLPHAVAVACAQLVMFYELLAGFLLFVPAARPWVIAAGMLFHLGIQATLSIRTLGFHFMWALLCLYPDPAAIATLAGRLGGWLPARFTRGAAVSHVVRSSPPIAGRDESAPVGGMDAQPGVPSLLDHG